MRYHIARAIKTVHINAVFITEEAKQARDTHRYIFSTSKKLFAHVITT